MGNWWSQCILFAQEAAEKVAEAPPGNGGGAPSAPPAGEWMFLVAIMIAGFYLLVIRPEQRRNRQKQDLIGSIKKNDKVLTIGGIYGVVANVKPNEDEIVIKIDEDKDVKIRVTKGSIAQVIASKEKDKEE
ncbi:MAG: preprotein translocase subunit YajC [Planctomycetota bacterium]